MLADVVVIGLSSFLITDRTNLLSGILKRIFFRAALRTGSLLSSMSVRGPGMKAFASSSTFLVIMAYFLAIFMSETATIMCLAGLRFFTAMTFFTALSLVASAPIPSTV